MAASMKAASDGHVGVATRVLLARLDEQLRGAR